MPDSTRRGPGSTTDAVGEVEALVVQCIARAEREGESAIEAVCAEHPRLADSLRRRMEVLRTAGLLVLDEPDADAFPERLGDFRLLERIGAGGMGVVYRARQESLGREVALKLIRPEHLYFPGARERFEREVATVARLQHPGIVPIHTVGEEGGLPYFAMELVGGCTLEAVLEFLAGCDVTGLDGQDFDRAIAGETGDGTVRKPSPLFAGSWSDACARIMRAVGDALEHAHRRGIVHRDLKPSNVIVTRDGRALLLDFGLSSSQAATPITRTGSFLGSLPYAAPERLRPGAAEVAPVSDVYGLGVTLYELLTLRPPFDATTEIDLHEQILRGSPLPVRRINPRVPWEIETVCHVAMEPDPARRYPTPAALARDLTNALESRPLEARRAGLVLRARRWARWHPAALVGLLAALLAVVGGPALYAWQQLELRRAVEAKNVELEASNAALGDANRALAEAVALADERGRAATAARDRAERSFWQAVDAVDALLARVGAVDLEEVPRMGPVQRDLLTEASRYYADFAADHPPDRRLNRGRGIVAKDLGIVHFKLGQPRLAIEAFERALDRIEPLAAEDPDDFVARDALATTLRMLALVHGAIGQRDEQARVNAWTAEVYEALQRDFPDDPNVACNAGSFYGRLGQQAARELDPVAAERHFARAVEMLAEVYRRAPADATVSALYGDSLREHGQALEAVGRGDEVEPLLVAALELARTTAERDLSRLHRRDLAKALTSLAAFYERTDRPALAQPLHVEMLAIVERLIADFPSVSVLHNDLLTGLFNLSRSYLEDTGDVEAARPLLARAEVAAARAVERFPFSAGTAMRAASLVRNRAYLALADGDVDRALELLDVAIERMLAAEPLDPGDPTARRLATRFTAQRVEFLLEAGDYARAPEAIRRYRRVDPESVEILRWCARYFARAAAQASAAGDLAAADRRAFVRECHGEALDTLEAAVAFGLDDLAGLARLPDLRTLAATPEFAALVEADAD